MPEEDSSKYFMVSLIIQQLYREILAVVIKKSFFESLGKWNVRAYRFFFMLYFTFTVKAKTTVDNDTDSPPTGDNSHMTLWIALLEASVFGLSGTAVCSKRKRAR